MNVEDLSEELIKHIIEIRSTLGRNEQIMEIKDYLNLRYLETRDLIKKVNAKYVINSRFMWSKPTEEVLRRNILLYGYEEGCIKAAEELNLEYKTCARRARDIGLKYILTLKEGEEIRPFIKGYYCTNLGRIFHKYKTGYKEIKPRNDPNGYNSVGICRDCYRVHRIIAQVFVPNPENKPIVDHINTDRHDNRACNLRWTTLIENMANTTTKLHLANSRHWVRYFQIIDRNTGELFECFTEKDLYKHLNLTYIDLHPGTVYYNNFEINMALNENINHSIGRWLRMGNTKEDLIQKVQDYSESKEYKKYSKSLEYDEA